MAGLHKSARTGIYAVQFYDADRTPSRKQVSTRTRDQRTARRLFRLWEAAYAEGSYDPWTSLPVVPSGPRKREAAILADARSLFLTSRSHRALNTRLNYERVTGWFVKYIGAKTDLRSVQSADIERWLATLEVKPITRANYVQHLRTWFRYCKAQRLIGSDPTENVRLERVPRHFPKALRPEQVECVAAFAEAHCRDGQRRSSAWAAPFIRLGAETAMRRNELLNLQWDHVDLEGGHLTVTCTDSFTSKSGAERRIPLSEKATVVLEGVATQRQSRTGLVLEAGGGAVHSGTCSKSVKRFAVAAGVPSLTPHVLRHSCITWLIERGVPVPIVQQFAGHADVSTTMRYCSIADDVYGSQIRDALGRGLT